jgi:hypothetical protein
MMHSTRCTRESFPLTVFALLRLIRNSYGNNTHGWSMTHERQAAASMVHGLCTVCHTGAAGCRIPSPYTVHETPEMDCTTDPYALTSMHPSCAQALTAACALLRGRPSIIGALQ